MRVTLDLELCRGHGRCYAICPEIFDEDEAGNAVLLRSDVPKELLAPARRAAENCPERAIRLEPT